MPLYRPSEFHDLGIKAKKRLSQNFLIDGNILEKICRVADIKPGDQVLEIGPGPGAITERLLEWGACVTAIEKDPSLAEKLHQLNSKDLKIQCEDALTFSLDPLAQNTKLIANLPFHITTPLIGRFIDQYPKISSMTLIVQKEVGLRMTAEKNSSLYSSFTLFVRTFSTPKYCFMIRPHSFFPIPSVQCGVVHLSLRSFPFPFDPDPFFLLTRKAFGQRRKMLRSSLKDLYPSELVERTLIALGFKPTARPQELSLEDFGSFFQKLCQT